MALTSASITVPAVPGMVTETGLMAVQVPVPSTSPSPREPSSRTSAAAGAAWSKVMVADAPPPSTRAALRNRTVTSCGPGTVKESAALVV